MNQSFYQFLRYAAVGLVSNGIGFFLYLLLTGAGLFPKVSMLLLYVLGVVQSFIFNKKWTFNHHGDQIAIFIRYFIVYFFGYFINLCALIIFVDRFGYPHQFVQFTMIPVIAIFIFLMQKIWVFRVQQ